MRRIALVVLVAAVAAYVVSLEARIARLDRDSHVIGEFLLYMEARCRHAWEH